METNNNEKSNKREIDIVSIVLNVFKAPVTFAIFTVVFGALGIAVALSTPKSYKSTAVLAPETANKMSLSGNLSEVASSFGVDLGNSSFGSSDDAIYPDIYPDLLASQDFLLGLFDVPVRLKDNDTLRTYKEHVKKDLKMSLADYPKYHLNNFVRSLNKEEGKPGKKEDAFKISREDFEICDGLGRAVSCIVNKKTSIISITMEDQDPLVAAIMVDTIQNRIQKYIIDYRTRKFKRDYEYFTNLYKEANVEYNKAQKEYADFCDANQDIMLESFKVKSEELENKLQKSYNVMSQLQTQMMGAEAKIQENTPAFIVIEKPRISYKPSSTPKIVILMGWIFFGFVCNIIWTNIRLTRKNHKKAKVSQ